MSNGDSEKAVSITLNSGGLPVPNQDPIEVKKANQKIRWSAAFQFTVDIEGYTDVKYGNSGGTYTAQTGTFASEKTYKYSITANGKTNDPDIIVKP